MIKTQDIEWRLVPAMANSVKKTWKLKMTILDKRMLQKFASNTSKIVKKVEIFFLYIYFILYWTERQWKYAVLVENLEKVLRGSKPEEKKIMQTSEHYISFIITVTN